MKKNTGLKARLGIIGGSGFYDMAGLHDKKWVKVSTPFGNPSDQFLTGKLDGQDVVFLARHGRGHRFLPGEINYRANIFGMKKLGVTWIVAASAVGSLKEEIRPLDFVILDQGVDRTSRREKTFFGNGIAAHISLADPFCEDLRRSLIHVCRTMNLRFHERGTYLNMEGPAFSTRAESNLYRSWGMDVIGMTNLVEAKLAREAQICYATMALVTDYDCWKDTHEDVSVEAVIANLKANTKNAQEVILKLIHHLPKQCATGCRTALSKAIITSPDQIPEKAIKYLKILSKNCAED